MIHDQAYARPRFTVLTTRRDGISVIHVVGELDMATFDAFDASVTEELAGGPLGVLLDLRRVRFLGSSGLHVLVRAKARAEELGIGLCLVADHAMVLRPLAISGLDVVLNVRPSLRDAATALAT